MSSRMTMFPIPRCALIAAGDNSAHRAMLLVRFRPVDQDIRA